MNDREVISAYYIACPDQGPDKDAGLGNQTGPWSITEPLMASGWQGAGQ
jgi:hypothetical protein